MNNTEQTSELFCPNNCEEWRTWLDKNHIAKKSVWLVYYKKKANKGRLTWSEAVDEALCFGWIDSISKPIDDEKYMQFFSKRKPVSTWSKINKLKIVQLTAAGLMSAAGMECIATAQQNGSWQILDDVEELKIPDDLALPLDGHPEAKRYFSGLSRSVTKAILQWIVLAKRPETRAKRIAETLLFAIEGMVPKQFRP